MGNIIERMLLDSVCCVSSPPFFLPAIRTSRSNGSKFSAPKRRRPGSVGTSHPSRSLHPSVRLRRDSLRHTTSSFLQHKCLRTPFSLFCLFLHVLRHAGKPLRRKTNQNNNNNNTNMCVTSTFGFRQSKKRKETRTGFSFSSIYVYLYIIYSSSSGSSSSIAHTVDVIIIEFVAFFFRGGGGGGGYQLWGELIITKKQKTISHLKEIIKKPTDQQT